MEAAGVLAQELMLNIARHTIFSRKKEEKKLIIGAVIFIAKNIKGKVFR